MRKALLVFGAAMLLAFTACGGDEVQPAAGTAAQTEAPQEVQEDDSEQRAREEAERLEREEAERLEREEAERLAAEEEERLAQEEAERLARELEELMAALEEELNTMLEILQEAYDAQEWALVVEFNETFQSDHSESEQALAAAELAETAREHLNAAGRAALANLREDHDMMTGHTWWEHRDSPQYTNIRNTMGVLKNQPKASNKNGTIEEKKW